MNLPHIPEPRLNKYIKEVGRIAGIDSPVEIISTNGGITKKSGYATVFVRIQSSRLGINIRQSTHLKVPVRKWLLPIDSVARRHYTESPEGYNIFSKLEKIGREINIRLVAGIPVTPDDVRLIVASTVLETDVSHLNGKESSGIRSIPLNEYIEKYIKGMEALKIFRL